MNNKIKANTWRDAFFVTLLVLGVLFGIAIAPARSAMASGGFELYNGEDNLPLGKFDLWGDTSNSFPKIQWLGDGTAKITMTYKAPITGSCITIAFVDTYPDLDASSDSYIIYGHSSVVKGDLHKASGVLVTSDYVDGSPHRFILHMVCAPRGTHSDEVEKHAVFSRRYILHVYPHT